LYLWQIRHIPNLRQTFFKLTSWRGLFLLIAIFLMGTDRPVSGNNDEETVSAENLSQQLKPVTKGASEAAAEIAKVQEVLRGLNSVAAEIEQTVSIGTQKFVVTGRYLSSGEKMRLEYVLNPDQEGIGELLEVCDGKELWSQMTLANSKRVTHRNIQQIKQAALASKAVPEASLVAELGLGGLSALIASLERSMIFEAMREESSSGNSRILIQGRWKEDYANQFRRKPQDPLPPYIPDIVRVVVDGQTHFPERIVYLKRQVQKDKKGFRPLVTLRFHKVQLNENVDEQLFSYTPPENVVPDDVTRQFIDRFTKVKTGEEKEQGELK